MLSVVNVRFKKRSDFADLNSSLMIHWLAALADRVTDWSFCVLFFLSFCFVFIFLFFCFDFCFSSLLFNFLF